MSFSKAKITRFNDKTKTGPPPTKYSPPAIIQQKVKGAVSFGKKEGGTPRTASRQSVSSKVSCPPLSRDASPKRSVTVRKTLSSLKARCPTTLGSATRISSNSLPAVKSPRSASLAGRDESRESRARRCGASSDRSRRSSRSDCSRRSQDDPTRVFDLRKRRFVAAQRDLETRRRQAVELWTAVTEASERVTAATGRTPELPACGDSDLQAFATLENKLRALPSRYSELCNRALERLGGDSALGEELQQASEQVAVEMDELVAALNTLDAHASLLETQNNDLSTQLSNAVSTLERERAYSKTEVESARISVEMMERRSTQATERVNKLQKELEEMRSSSEKFEDVTKQRSELEARLAEVTAFHEQREAELNERCVSLQQKLALSSPDRGEELWTELQSTTILLRAAETRANSLEEKLVSMRPPEELERELEEMKTQMAAGGTGIEDMRRRIHELESTLGVKQVEVEQLDRRLHEQAKLLKVRDELIGLSRGKERQQEEVIANLQAALAKRDRNSEEVSRDIASKDEELRQLYTTLKDKQLQVLQTEKLVHQLEEQHERSQAQRTRMEARIAELESAAATATSGTRPSRFYFM